MTDTLTMLILEGGEGELEVVEWAGKAPVIWAGYGDS